MKSFSTKHLLSISYWLLSWALLVWLNFSIEPNAMVHFVMIPALLLITGLNAASLCNKKC